MIEVTNDAVVKLTEILEEEKATDSALRVVVVPSGQGVQYMLTLEDEPTDEDVITESGGLRLLFDSQNADFMEGVKIDYIEDIMRSGFVISNPNFPMTGGCGCGAGGGGCGCGASEDSGAAAGGCGCGAGGGGCACGGH
jgi:iron-sulfur cluster assembly protein